MGNCISYIIENNKELPMAIKIEDDTDQINKNKENIVNCLLYYITPFSMKNGTANKKKMIK
jgi:hypothetical protein